MFYLCIELTVTLPVVFLKAYRFSFEIYYSTDCVEWTKVENDIIKSFYGDGINMQKDK